MSQAGRSNHTWQFSRAGGFDQAQVNSAADFTDLENLDQKLWAALACPVKGLEFDEQTLALIDGDGDGRIRAPEVIAAVQWAEDHLKSLDALKAGGDTLPLAQINDGTDSGKALLASANQLLTDLGKGDSTSISLEDVNSTAKVFAEARFNGDGVVPADSAEDEALQAAITEIIDCMGAVDDRSGKPGVNQDNVDAFFTQAGEFTEWAALADSDEAILALGDGTGAASGACAAIAAKVDDFFSRCRLAAYDERALVALNRREEEYLAIAAEDLSVTVQEVAGFPLARVEVGAPLPLTGAVNPAWAAAMDALRTAAVEPALGDGKATLTADEWATVRGKVAAYDAWQGAKPAGAVEKLGLDRLKELLAGDSKEKITALIAEDAALAAEFEAIGQVERLVRYHRDLHALCRNFVNFADFYTPEKMATFQAGTLYLDGRACDLVVRVTDAGKHGKLAGMSKAYLAYCNCTRPSGEKMQIAAAFTNGDSDYLMVGRNGIFYDREGRDWDATITKVIDNPISIRQAFWAPYKKFVRLVEETVAKRAAAKDAEANKKLGGAATATGTVDKAPPAAPKKMDVGTVAALGVAVGAIGAFLTAIIGYFTGIFALPFWIILLIIIGLFVLISTPSMLMAWLKLRQRNMAPILDSNGWAVNGRAKLTVRFGKTMTHLAELPAGAKVSGDDPYSDPVNPWPKLLMLVVIACFAYSLLNWFGLIHQWTDGEFGDPEKKEEPAEVVVEEPADKPK